MLVFTHSLGPVAVKQMTEIMHPEKYEYFNQLRGWLVIAAAGVLPDVLTPHITLGDRYNSFSHTWVFTGIFVGCCILCSAILFRKNYRSIPLWCAAAYLLHLAEDLISGGIDFFSTGHVIGDYYVSPIYWPLIDLYIVVIVILLDRKIRKQHKI
ncbi:MAG: hypothetical protein A2X48_04270 [Lentisphaerae bacterium GWF2_49_21]|nr:MAG: hypothetical protein A2X48_04270 [Lentisphaerae bacterium GWF2_49_21]